MKCRFRFLVTKHLLVATALGLLVQFLPALSQAQITPSGESYTNTADPTINYVSRTLEYFAAIALAFTILVAWLAPVFWFLRGSTSPINGEAVKSCRSMSRIAAV